MSTYEIALRFEQIAASRASHVALVFDDRSFSYSELLQLSKSFAIKLETEGVGPSSFVCLDSSDGLKVLATAFATAMLGARLAVGHEDILQFTGDQPDHWFHDGERNAVNPSSKEINLSWGALERPKRNVTSFARNLDVEKTWLIVHTSGTTGAPKFVGLSQKLVALRSDAAAADFFPNATAYCSLFQANSRPFLSRALAVLLAGETLVVSRDTATWKKAGVNIVMGSPTQIRASVSDWNFEEKLPVIQYGGGPLDDGLIHRLVELFEKVLDTYGATETNHSFDTTVEVSETGVVMRSGQPRDSIVQIVNHLDEPLSQGQIGFVRVKNPYLADGYIDDSASTERFFRGGWFYPGDMASWGAERALQLHGRQDHVLNIGGFKVNALAIDAAMAEIEGIKDAVCFKSPKRGAFEDVLAFVELDGAISELQAEASVKFKIKEHFGNLATPRRVRPIDRVPRDASGVADRAFCQRLVENRIASLKQ